MRTLSIAATVGTALLTSGGATISPAAASPPSSPPGSLLGWRFRRTCPGCIERVERATDLTVEQVVEAVVYGPGLLR